MIGIWSGYLVGTYWHHNILKTTSHDTCVTDVVLTYGSSFNVWFPCWWSFVAYFASDFQDPWRTNLEGLRRFRNLSLWEIQHKIIGIRQRDWYNANSRTQNVHKVKMQERKNPVAHLNRGKFSRRQVVHRPPAHGAPECLCRLILHNSTVLTGEHTTYPKATLRTFRFYWLTLNSFPIALLFYNMKDQRIGHFGRNSSRQDKSM